MPALPTGIDRLPSGKYRVRASVQGRRITRTVGSLTQARKALAELSLSTPASAGAVAGLVGQWFDGKQADLGDYTAIGYEQIIRLYILPYIGDVEYSDVTAADIDRFYLRLDADGVSNNQIRRVHGILAQAFKRAARWQLIPYSPVAAVTPPATSKHQIDPPTAEQVAELLAAAAATHPGFGTYCRVAAVTGIRRGELVALRGDDVDLDTAEILVRRALTRASPDPTKHHGAPVPGHPRLVEKSTKTGNQRRIAIDPFTVASLRAHRTMLATRALSCGVGLDLEQHRWFTDDPAAEIPWGPDSPTAWWSATRRNAGHPHVRLHDLRHFAATQALAAGVDVRTVAGRLGHTNVAMTLNTYSHVVPAADRAAADILGKIVGR